MNVESERLKALGRLGLTPAKHLPKQEEAQEKKIADRKKRRESVITEMKRGVLLQA